jgi:hypothetical protein
VVGAAGVGDDDDRGIESLPAGGREEAVAQGYGASHGAVFQTPI